MQVTMLPGKNRAYAAPADLRECDRVFRELRGCNRIHFPMPCFACPIMRDILAMARKCRAGLTSDTVKSAEWRGSAGSKQVFERYAVRFANY